MRARLGLLALAGVLVAAAACSGLRALPGGDAASSYLEGRGRKNAEQVGSNAVDMVAKGEAGKSASFSMEQEFQFGRTVAAQVVARLGGRVHQPEHRAARYLREVGTVLALSAAELRGEGDRPYPLRGYRFLLVEAAQVNAVGMPGGFVAVTTGALRAARSEDELAAVVAHEIAHVQRGHAMDPVESARRQEHLTEGLLKGTDSVVHAFFGKVVGLGTELVLDRGYGKANELAADAFAMKVLAAAGYDPAALPAFLRRLDGKAAEGGFLARHPPAAERVAALEGTKAGSGEPAVRVPRFAAAVAALDQGPVGLVRP